MRCGPKYALADHELRAPEIRTGFNLGVFASAASTSSSSSAHHLAFHLSRNLFPERAHILKKGTISFFFQPADD